MIAALYASRSNGKNSSNKFLHDEQHFGWENIEAMLAREVLRRTQNRLPRVPGLKESHVYRDPWTRLNVKPAKIMQVRSILINFIELWIVLVLFNISVFVFNSKNMY